LPRLPRAQVLAQEAASADRAAQRSHQEARALEAESLGALSEAASAEKSSAKTAADIRGARALARGAQLRGGVEGLSCSLEACSQHPALATAPQPPLPPPSLMPPRRWPAPCPALRDACDKEETRIVEIQNELAKLQVGCRRGQAPFGVRHPWSTSCLPRAPGFSTPPLFPPSAAPSLPAPLTHQVDMLNTEAHNARLGEALQLLDDEIKDKVREGRSGRLRRSD
jgi:hypothetical protein